MRIKTSIAYDWTVRVILALLVSLLARPVDGAWLKGNLHTHTSESDGDSAPAAVVDWYASHGYAFLAITDHDKLTRVEPRSGIVLIPGEEITDRYAKKPLHVNAFGIDAAIAPAGGSSIVDVLTRNVVAVREAGGIALVNHPNFGWAFGANELLQIPGEFLLEVASGHPYVNMEGPPSAEWMWDQLLSSGRRIWGAAVDDSHHLARPLDPEAVTPGKAWVMVRAEKAEPAAILAALRSGDFYASNGPELETWSNDPERVELRVRAKHGARYRIQFIGDGGRVLQETSGPAASYEVTGSERYVRAKVIDSNGLAAWTQPMFVRSRSSSH